LLCSAADRPGSWRCVADFFVWGWAFKTKTEFSPQKKLYAIFCGKRYVRRNGIFCRVQQPAFHFFARASFCERLKDFTEYSKRDAVDLLSDAVNAASFAGL